MGFRLVPKSVTLNDLERRNGRYFALFQRIFMYAVAVKQLLGLHRFQNLLLILYNHLKPICAIIQRLFGQIEVITGFYGCIREQIIDYLHRLGRPQIFIVESTNQQVGSMGVGAGLYMYAVVVQKFTFAISSMMSSCLFFCSSHNLRLFVLISKRNSVDTRSTSFSSHCSASGDVAISTMSSSNRRLLSSLPLTFTPIHPSSSADILITSSAQTLKDNRDTGQPCLTPVCMENQLVSSPSSPTAAS